MLPLFVMKGNKMAKSNVHYAVAGALASLSRTVDDARIATRQGLYAFAEQVTIKGYKLVDKINKAAHKLYYKGAQARVLECKSAALAAQARSEASRQVVQEAQEDNWYAQAELTKAIQLENQYSKNVSL